MHAYSLNSVVDRYVLNRNQLTVEATLCTCCYFISLLLIILSSFNLSILLLFSAAADGSVQLLLQTSGMEQQNMLCRGWLSSHEAGSDDEDRQLT